MVLDPEDVPGFLVACASILAAVFLLGFLALRVNWPFRPTRAEVGHRPKYTVRVGCGYSTMFLSAPFVRVTTYDDFVVVASLLFGPYVLRRVDGVRIERVVRTEPLWGLRQTSLIFRHALPRIPRDLELFARELPALEAALRASLEPPAGSRPG